MKTDMNISMNEKCVGALVGAVFAAMIAAAGVIPGSGMQGMVNASEFGWNATNATQCLQAAIDSGAKKVVIDRRAGDWIVGPIFLRVSGQEVVVADGVTVRALKGSFKKRGECLFKIDGKVSGITLRGEGYASLVMNKTDYQNSREYVHSEWRHAVSIAGSGTSVSNLTILSSGGDGVYVKGNAKDVVLENLVCRDHHRQGISVISATRLRVRNCRFDDTAGTAPQCGVDIEPNRPNDRLEDILFEDCIFDGNASGGMTLHLPALKMPVSITFRRCVARGNSSGISIHSTRHYDKRVTGRVHFEDCHVSGNRRYALRIGNQKVGGLSVVFERCKFDALASDCPVLFDNANIPFDFCGIRFVDSKVITGLPVEKAVRFEYMDGVGVAQGGVTGTLFLERKNGETQLFDMDGLSKRYPSNPKKMKMMRSFSSREIDFRATIPKAGAKPLDEPVSTGWMRGRFTFVQTWSKAGDYPVVFRAKAIGKRRTDARVQMRDAAGTDLGSFTVAHGTTVTNVIHAVRAGVRRFEISGGLVCVESRWPGHGVMADYGVPLYKGKNRSLFFTVPADAPKVLVQIRSIDGCSAKLLYPDGTVADEMPYNSSRTAVLSADRVETSEQEVWSVIFPEILEDARIRIGAPCVPVVSTGSPDMAPTVR